MIAGIGIDAVEIERFKDWHKKPNKSLERIFSPAEIDYCLSIPSKSAERFAARFAAKEAFLKALQPLSAKTLPLLTLAPAICVENKPSGQPFLNIHEQKIARFCPFLTSNPLTAHISLCHTRSTASAYIILEKLTDIKFKL